MIPLFITKLIEGKLVPVYGTGSNVRDWLFVDDHCEAIDLVFKKGILGEAYLSIDYTNTYYFTDTGRSWSENAVNLRDKQNKLHFILYKPINIVYFL